MTQAVVIGGGIAGLLSAAALTTHLDRVIIVEKDQVPNGPEHRPGTPQSHHVHGLLARGVQEIGALLPHFTTDLVSHGAPVIDFAQDVALLTPFGWAPRFPSGINSYGASRLMVESVIRRRVLAHPKVALHARHTVEALHGTSRSISSVSARNLDSSRLLDLRADLVVDATGRASASDRWLGELGCPPVSRTVIDSRTAYVSRQYRIPVRGTPDWRACILQPAAPHRPYGATLVPIEQRRWILTLIGVDWHQPPRDPAEFLASARSLATPVIADAITAAEPLTDPVTTRTTSNIRRHLERAPGQPGNLVRTGDAACAFNPVYAQGMSMAAASAVLLRDHLGTHALDDRFARPYHRRLAALHDWAWTTAATADARWPHTHGPRPGPPQRLALAYADRVMAAAVGSPRIQRAVLEVYHLRRPPHALLSPPVLVRTALLTTRKPNRS
ncbi:FAD-dependent oxidoreductase [Streptomyces klenkii]|uniref:FAD-dependent oxidoreductase n=1 Tax=Streptomyces klenkii TaxID=1420899 RepID=UPI00342F785A